MEQIKIDLSAGMYADINASDESQKAAMIIGYKGGAAHVNEKQPYTAEDMKLFHIWMKGLISNDRLNTNLDHSFFYRNKLTNVYELKNFNEILKVWKESEND